MDASSFKDVEQSDDDDQRFNVQIYDTLKVVENFVNDIEIPTICAVNGRGIHWEMAMMSDITLCTPDFILQDDHFVMKGGHVPGDGMTLALQQVLGIKRGNYMSYTNQGIDAETCLRLGAVNEIVERERIVERAWELARLIMKTNRSTRRLTHHVAVRPWRELVEQNLRQHVYAEMYSFNLVKSSHDFDSDRVLRRQDREDVGEEKTMALQPYVHVETLEEYAERFKDFAHLERNEEGILFCRLHWQGEACVWSYQTQNAYGELWTAIGHDKENEIVILTCADPYWITQRSDPASFDEVEDSDSTTLKYNCNVPDTMNFVENFINDIEVPVITAINGIGQHYEFGLMADICICDPDFYFSDAHFSHNIVPGDGMNFSYRMCLGQRRASYMAYMEPKIDAQTALQWGLIDEIVAHDQLIPRSYEIARHILKTGRAVRRLTHECVMRPWKRFLQDDERVRVLAEMYAVQLEATRHNFDKIAADFTGDRPQHRK